MTEIEADANRPLRVVGRYAVYGKLATGGMATVHFGRLLGPVGFSRTVAIKRLHPQFAKDPEFVAMFLDEARLAARIQHPNVVATLDVVAMGEELFLVMDYIRGESLSRLLRAARRRNISMPEGFLASVLGGMLHGLHAAHEATDERGQPLRVVHRDVSPQNLLVGTDGVARVLDFGVAKAAARIQITRDGQMKGKLSYMSPEQLSGRPVDRRSDIFAAGVVLWESLTGERLFVGEHATEVLTKILKDDVPKPSSVNPRVRPAVDAIVARALTKDPDERYQTAREFAIAVEENMELLSSREVGEWVEEIAGDSLSKREQALAEIEGISSISELSAMTPSEPSFMKTMTGTSEDSRRVRVWQKAGPTKPAAPEADKDDEATTIYHSQPSGVSSPGTPQGGVHSDPDDPTAVFDMDQHGDVTNPAAFQDSEGHPFRPPPFWTSRVGTFVIVAGLTTLLAFILAAFFWGPEEAAVELPQATPPKRQLVEPTKETRPATEGSAASATDVVATPAATSEVQVADEAIPSSNKASPSPGKTKVWSPRQPAVTPQPKRPRADCDPPFTVNRDGIRKVKPECLR